MNSNFNRLNQRHGKYSIHALIHIYDDSGRYDMRYVDSRKAVTLDGHVYKAGSFSYTRETSEGGFTGGGKLRIAVKDNEAIDLIENADAVHLDATIALIEGGEVEPLQTVHHHYCNVEGTKTEITATFEKDDRPNMTFPTLIWTAINNRGNS